MPVDIPVEAHCQEDRGINVDIEQYARLHVLEQKIPYLVALNP